MKLNITHNTQHELILRTQNESDLWKTWEQSITEGDFGVLKSRFDYLFDYTGDQLAVVKAEWEASHNDWYWENVPAE
jgi:hypothetical protein